jgi:hypothetical protein
MDSNKKEFHVKNFIKAHFVQLFGIIALVTIIGFSMTACVSQQKVSKEDSTYSETVNVFGMSKDALFDRVNMWCADTFIGPVANVSIPEENKSKIISADKNQSTITAKHTLVTEWYFSEKNKTLALVFSNIAIYISDGQYRLVCTTNGFNAYFPADANISRMGFTKTVPLDGRLVNVNRASWKDIADALRNTVSGTLAVN